MREQFRGLYFRSAIFRRLAPLFIKDKAPRIDYSHLFSFSEEQIGPVQRDEALLLFGLTRTINPETVVEFGFQNGHSALNFLLAASPECRVFSYDISDRSEEIAQRCLHHFKNFQFIRKSQTDFAPSDIDFRKIDLCFLDASHDTDMNLKTFELILPELSDGAILAVHDTGVWNAKLFAETHSKFVKSDLGKEMGQWIDAERYQPVVEERRFVNTLLNNYPEFSQIHLHCLSKLRMGLTLLQRRQPLMTEPVGSAAI